MPTGKRRVIFSDTYANTSKIYDFCYNSRNGGGHAMGILYGCFLLAVWISLGCGWMFWMWPHTVNIHKKRWVRNAFRLLLILGGAGSIIVFRERKE